MNRLNILSYLTFAMMSILFVFSLFILIGWRWIMKQIVKKTGKIILTDSYQENIMELIPGLRHMGIQNMLENSLRAETGTVLHVHLLALQKSGRIWIRLPLFLHRRHRFQLMVKKK